MWGSGVCPARVLRKTQRSACRLQAAALVIESRRCHGERLTSRCSLLVPVVGLCARYAITHFPSLCLCQSCVEALPIEAVLAYIELCTSSED
mmetsp:Transcript_5191/g.12492  ORF Transcript_5191/g.12492 Transcript_5191/m.12492 type:complete len:92 (+) Transcript_5191:15-290(+)